MAQERNKESPATIRRSAARRAIVDAAASLVAELGFKKTQVAAVALRAGVGVGTIYQNFGSRGELLRKVFRTRAEHEFDIVQTSVAELKNPTVASQVVTAISIFCTRALRAGSYGYALMIEPVDEQVEDERLETRKQYHAYFADLLRQGIERGEIPEQNAEVTAAALVGLMVETLIQPLSEVLTKQQAEELVEATASLSLRVIGAEWAVPADLPHHLATGEG